MSLFVAFDTIQITTIAEEVFAAMVDGEPGLLLPWVGEAPVLTDPLHAWIEIHGAFAGRTLLSTEAATADDLARALLGMGADDPVSEDDLVDAFGEVVNVVGGNLKALLPVQEKLTMPRVGRTAPETHGATRIDGVLLSWRGRPLDVSVWQI
jgi:hypothetical protein